ncbi:hypothetical protein HN587_02780 [Candidatus Woesearchaeota archaeon]|jgi:hypothetical protein|nr:hypothetical protein [Candidatus Woesearchaeota archaeon]
MAEPQLEWKYNLENRGTDHPDWFETFTATYNGKPVELTIRDHMHPIAPRGTPDGLTLRFYTDDTRTDFIALTAPYGTPDEANFVKPLKPQGQTSMTPEEAPNLATFVRDHKPVFESQRDLRETFEQYL